MIVVEAKQSAPIKFVETGRPPEAAEDYLSFSMREISQYIPTPKIAELKKCAQVLKERSERHQKAFDHLVKAVPEDKQQLELQHIADLKTMRDSPLRLPPEMDHKVVTILTEYNKRLAQNQIEAITAAPPVPTQASAIQAPASPVVAPKVSPAPSFSIYELEERQRKIKNIMKCDNTNLGGLLVEIATVDLINVNRMIENHPEKHAAAPSAEFQHLSSHHAFLMQRMEKIKDIIAVAIAPQTASPVTPRPKSFAEFLTEQEEIARHQVRTLEGPALRDFVTKQISEPLEAARHTFESTSGRTADRLRTHIQILEDTRLEAYKKLAPRLSAEVAQPPVLRDVVAPKFAPPAETPAKPEKASFFSRLKDTGRSLATAVQGTMQTAFSKAAEKVSDLREAVKPEPVRFNPVPAAAPSLFGGFRKAFVAAALGVAALGAHNGVEAPETSFASAGTVKTIAADSQIIDFKNLKAPVTLAMNTATPGEAEMDTRYREIQKPVAVKSVRDMATKAFTAVQPVAVADSGIIERTDGGSRFDADTLARAQAYASMAAAPAAPSGS